MSLSLKNSALFRQRRVYGSRRDFYNADILPENLILYPLFNGRNDETSLIVHYEKFASQRSK